MAMVPKARDLEQPLTGATIRLAQRESFDARKAIGVPSATGGAPKQNFQPQIETPPLPPLDLSRVSDTATDPAEQAFWRQREAPTRSPIIPFLLRTSRPLEDYDVANKDFIDHMASTFEQLAVTNPAWKDRLEGAKGPRELALSLVAQWQRAHEPDATSTDLPATIHRSRETQEVGNILDWIHQQRGRR